jgi:hypothetical protein
LSSVAEKNDFDFRAIKVEVTDDQLCVTLADGREIRNPLEFYPKLANANKKVRENFRIMAQGIGIEWPDIDEHLSIEGIVLGRRAIEW